MCRGEMASVQPVLAFMGFLFIMLGYVQYHVGKAKLVNWFVGFRIPVTMRHPEVWKMANTRTGLLISLHGTGMLAIGLIAEVDLSSFLLVLLLPVLACMIHGVLYASQLKRRMGKEGLQTAVLPLPGLKAAMLLAGLLFLVGGCLTYYVREMEAINGFIGVRIPPALNDPEVWGVVNVQSGFLMALHGAFMIAIGLKFPEVKFGAFLLILLSPLGTHLSHYVWYAYQL